MRHACSHSVLHRACDRFVHPSGYPWRTDNARIRYCVAGIAYNLPQFKFLEGRRAQSSFQKVELSAFILDSSRLPSLALCHQGVWETCKARAADGRCRDVAGAACGRGSWSAPCTGRHGGLQWARSPGHKLHSYYIIHFKYMCVYIYIYIYMFLFMCIYIYITYERMCMYIYTHIHTHIHTHLFSNKVLRGA